MKQKMKTKNVLVVIFILIFTFISANSAEAQPIHNNRNLPERFYKRYSKVFDDGTIVMHLNKDGDYFVGNCFINNVLFELTGTINENYEIILKEKVLKNDHYATLEVLINNDSTITIYKTIESNKETVAFELTEQKYKDYTIDVLNKNNSYCVNGYKPKSTDDNYDLLPKCSFIDINYLQFNTNTNLLAGHRINNAIIKRISSLNNDENNSYSTIDALLNSVKFVDKEMGGFDQSIGQYVFYANDDFVSILSQDFTQLYQTNPMLLIELKNFDLKTGNQIKLSDLFIPNYKSELNKIAYKVFFYSNDKEEWGDYLDENSFEVNENFAITSAGLFFLYNKGELNRDVVTFYIPFNEIIHLIKPGSVFDKAISENQNLLTNQTKANQSQQNKMNLPIPEGYRLPTKADVEADEQNNGEISDWNAFKEMFPTPYLVEGDFNGDGRKDKAYILIKDNYHDWGLFCFFNTESGYVAKRVPFDSSYKGYNVKNMLVFKWNKEVCSNEKGELKSPKKFKYDVIGLGVFETCDEIACFYNVNNDKFEKYFGCFD